MILQYIDTRHSCVSACLFLLSAGVWCVHKFKIVVATDFWKNVQLVRLTFWTRQLKIAFLKNTRILVIIFWNFTIF